MIKKKQIVVFLVLSTSTSDYQRKKELRTREKWMTLCKAFFFFYEQPPLLLFYDEKKTRPAEVKCLATTVARPKGNHLACAKSAHACIDQDKECIFRSVFFPIFTENLNERKKIERTRRREKEKYCVTIVFLNQRC